MVHNQGIKTWNTQFWYTSMVLNFMKKSNTASSFMVISWNLVAPWGFWNNQNWRLFDSVIFQILRTGSSLILIFSKTQTGDSLLLILKTLNCSLLTESRNYPIPNTEKVCPMHVLLTLCWSMDLKFYKHLQHNSAYCCYTTKLNYMTITKPFVGFKGIIMVTVGSNNDYNQKGEN